MPRATKAVAATKKATAKEATSAAQEPSKRAASKRKPVSDAVSESAPSTAEKFLEEMRAQLLHERAGYVEQAAVLKAEAEQLAAEMEPGDIQFDEESGEGGTMNIVRERDLALSAQARAAVDEIDRALLKLDAGKYGLCERCGEPIKRARLKVLPHASMCIACKSGGLSRR